MISFDIGPMYIRFAGTYKKRPFCYFGGCQVVTFGDVYNGTFKIEPTSLHKDLIDECRKQLQDSPQYEAFRQGKTQMQGKNSAVHANGVQGENKPSRKPNKRKRSA